MRIPNPRLPDKLRVSLPDHGESTWSLTPGQLLDLAGTAGRQADYTARKIAFWAAVVLPFLSVALVLSGLRTRGQIGLLAGLIVANVIALRLGHPHHSPE